METQEIYNDFFEIREALWEIDIPSPTVPEYIEHHEQVQGVMRLVEEKMAKYWKGVRQPGTSAGAYADQPTLMYGA